MFSFQERLFPSRNIWDAIKILVYEYISRDICDLFNIDIGDLTKCNDRHKHAIL